MKQLPLPIVPRPVKRRRPVCRHAGEDVRPGPHVPAHYGSWATQVCLRCGVWRLDKAVTGVINPWREPPMPSFPDEDDDGC